MSVTATDLTGTERAVLLVLMAESRPVPNPELAVLGPALDKAGRDKLNRLGLIESERVANRFVHELTDRGWRLCRDIIAAGAPPRSTGPAKTLYTVLGALGRHLDRADLSLAEVFAPAGPVESVESRVRAAYRRLAERPGGWVSLTELRAELDLPRAEVDAALATLHRSPGVAVIPQEDQKVLTEADRAAAVLIGDRPKHLIAIEA
ncbi:hypothetical protein C6A87_004955 [Mycobacterium sp. ITM-2016-00317]|uniref:hypothetical protein n=1 Tax=Mycobacterium sp. ITM-2016-00317 TaxID=2099694 RepID=UPI00287FB5EA|nr:hypothetical protein [Mycobacterium sp. ITM-2016-00317]WNG88589.1 hypothetical protein C6A87_004955 [Mycobacterium sp. ITM-2016-00317]